METQEIPIGLMDWARSAGRDPCYTSPKYQSATPPEHVSVMTLPVKRGMKPIQLYITSAIKNYVLG